MHLLTGRQTVKATDINRKNNFSKVLDKYKIYDIIKTLQRNNTKLINKEKQK